MLTKLDELEKRFEELNVLLASPEVVSNQERLRELGKEHSELEKVVYTYRQLKKVKSDLAASKGLIEDESDEELIELAKEEITELTSTEAELEKELEMLRFELDKARSSKKTPKKKTPFPTLKRYTIEILKT